MSGVNLIGDETARKQLNRLAREQLKKRLLNDILIDQQVCKLEGWDQMEYIAELRELLNSLGKNVQK